MLARYDIPLENCVSIGLDNTSANMGCNNSMKTRITHDNLSVYVSGCVCATFCIKRHLKLGKFCSVHMFDIEDFTSDKYNHFNNSQPQKKEFATFCEFVQTNFKKILKHVAQVAEIGAGYRAVAAAV